MRHFLLLLCSLLLFTNAVSANEFTGYLTSEWGVELSINIEEVTSSHITQNDIQTTEGSACPEFLCVCMDVRDEEKSSFDSYRKRVLIKPQTWKIPNIRNAIPKSEDSFIIGIAYTSHIAVDAPEMDLLSDMASCTLCATSQEQQNWFTNESLYAHANLRSTEAEGVIFAQNAATSRALLELSAEGCSQKALREESNNTLNNERRLDRNSALNVLACICSATTKRQLPSKTANEHRCKQRTERSDSPRVAFRS